MKKFLKPAALLLILAGAITGVLLFVTGDAEDAPGLSLIGLVLAFLLILWGLYNAGMIPKSFLVPVLLSCFGAGGIVFTAALLLDGEFEKSPGLAFVGAAFGIVLITAGIIRTKKVVQERKREK